MVTYVRGKRNPVLIMIKVYKIEQYYRSDIVGINGCTLERKSISNIPAASE